MHSVMKDWKLLSYTELYRPWHGALIECPSQTLRLLCLTAKRPHKLLTADLPTLHVTGPSVIFWVDSHPNHHHMIDPGSPGRTNRNRTKPSAQLPGGSSRCQYAGAFGPLPTQVAEGGRGAGGCRRVAVRGNTGTSAGPG